MLNQLKEKIVKPTQTSSKTILITGASSGIGKCKAQYLASKGYQVYGTSRHPESCPGPGNVCMINMDVRDTASVTGAIAHIVGKQGHIDVLINNAGVGIGGAVEDTSTQMAKALFDTNFFGIFRVLQQVLPVRTDGLTGSLCRITSLGKHKAT